MLCINLRLQGSYFTSRQFFFFFFAKPLSIKCRRETVREQHFVMKQRARVMAFKTEQLPRLMQLQHREPHGTRLSCTPRHREPDAGGDESHERHGDSRKGIGQGKQHLRESGEGNTERETKPNENGEEEQQKRKRRCTMATSYSHPSRQPGEPHTKTNGTFSLLERANAARCSYTAMCSFTDGVCVCGGEGFFCLRCL